MKTFLTAVAVAFSAIAAQGATPADMMPAEAPAAETQVETAVYCEWVTVYDYWGNWVTLYECY